MKPRKPTSSPPQRLSAAAHEVRILGGTLKRSKLHVLDAPGLRPTPSRVRETLFNWLGQDLNGWRCIDAFAGTGALGIEAASRGAREVVLIEQWPPAAKRLLAEVERLGVAPVVRVQAGDALAHMQRLKPAAYDVVFLDPPFSHAPLFVKALQAAARCVVPDGWAYLEAPELWTEERLTPLGWQLVREGHAGAVHFHLLQRMGSAIQADTGVSSQLTSF